MTGDHLKLTAYFAERSRAHGRFLADALMSRYAADAVATSIVLRGTASYGPHHDLRSDRTLSLSEDPPNTVIALDTAEKMASLADEVAAMTHRGLVALERVRLVGASTPAAPAAAKLTVYLGRQDRIGGQPAHVVACDLLYRHGFAGAAAFLGVDGTTLGARRRARFFSRNIDVPMMVIAIGVGTQVDSAVAELRAQLPAALITIERTQLCKRDGRILAPPAALPATDAAGRGLWQKLMIYTSEATLHDSVPVHRAIVRRLFDSRAAQGVTVLRGVWGFHDDHKPHGDKLIQVTRRVPVTTIVIDTPERIAGIFGVVDELTGRHGLVTSELVPALVSIDDGRRLGTLSPADYRY
jgi:PII-like signaling protein